MKKVLVILLIFYSIGVSAQSTIWLNTEKAMPSYTLFSERSFRGENVFLVDNCGNFINTWAGVSPASHHYKLLPNGNLIGIQDDEYIVELDWGGNEVVSVHVSDSNLMLNYEVIDMDNGHYLCLGRRIESASFFANLGYNPNLGDPTYCDVVVEVDALGTIVWEWRRWFPISR